MTVMAVNSILEGWTIFTVLAIACEWVPRSEHVSTLAVIQQALPIILFVQPPGILAGWWIMRDKLWAIQLCLGTGIGMTVIAVLLSLSWFTNPFSWLWNDLPGLSMLIYSMFAALCLLQTVACAVAWIAVRWPLK